jgi:hypothetical protein
MDRWGAVEEVFFDGVAVQAGDRAQPPRDRGSGATEVLEMASEALDVVTGDVEQGELSVLAPARELTKVQSVGIAGQARVPAEEPDQGPLLDAAEHAVSAALHRQS